MAGTNRTVAMLSILLGSALVQGAEVPSQNSRREIAANAWFDRDGTPADGATVGAGQGLEVLANNDPVQRNARGGKPLKIKDRSFTRGLFCHAISHVVVHLPAPAAKFFALVGVDSNDQTTPGKGSVIASLVIADSEKFKSVLLHEGMPAVPVEVDLGGAMSFSLKVGDAGDGISSDQTDWAEARVELKDGKTLWLADLPDMQPPLPPLGQQPFSFVYNGEPSSKLLPTWKVERAQRKIDGVRTERTTTWTDPKTGLEVKCDSTEYGDFPILEWTIHFKNTGASKSPVIDHVQAIDLAVTRVSGGGSDFILHHATGTPVSARDYGPIETPLKVGDSVAIRANNGKPLNSDMPYFNVAWGDGSTGLGISKNSGSAADGMGVIAVLGWPGNWASSFSRSSENAVRVQAGQGLTHFSLEPGEEVRSPLAVAEFYGGDWIHGQNIWRRWMIAHNLPRPGGKLPPPALTPCSSHQYAEMTQANEENQKMFIDRYVEEQLKPDYWWMDAGWYPCAGDWTKTGTWEVDTTRFPKGLRAVSDHAHEKGVKTIVWFEPERVGDPNSWISKNHPDWIWGGSTGLLKLGMPEVQKWLTDHIDKLIDDQGIDLYRQDFNIDPLGAWRAGDAPDRSGVNEIRHVEGYLRYWDALIQRHPNMLIDSCASGGCRNDLETLRRGVPLLRSDSIMEPVAQQNHTYGCAMWIPFFGTGIDGNDAYVFRSQMTVNLIGAWDLRDKSLNYPLIRKSLAQWRQINSDYFGDFYPLTPYDPSPAKWMAWQFNTPEKGTGFVQAFRRQETAEQKITVRLRGLDGAATYCMTDFDADKTTDIKGAELMGRGIELKAEAGPAAKLIRYELRSGN